MGVDNIVEKMTAGRTEVMRTISIIVIRTAHTKDQVTNINADEAGAMKGFVGHHQLRHGQALVIAFHLPTVTMMITDQFNSRRCWRLAPQWTQENQMTLTIVHPNRQ